MLNIGKHRERRIRFPSASAKPQLALTDNGQGSARHLGFVTSSWTANSSSFAWRTHARSGWPLPIFDERDRDRVAQRGR